MTRRVHTIHWALTSTLTALLSIAASGTSALAYLNDGLIANWCFDTNSANDCWDGFNGTNYGAAWVNGKIGKAFEFTGSDGVDGISASFDDSVSAGLTVAAWVYWYPGAPYDACYILDARTGITGGFIFFVYSDDTIQLSLRSPGGIQDVNSLSTLPFYQWTHVAGVFDNVGNTLRVFINGVPDGTATAPYAYYHTTGSATIGNNRWRPPYVPFNGVIDELRFYNRALSANEIADLAGGGAPTGPCCLAGSCQDLTQAACTAQGGTWYAGTTCASHNCPPVADGGAPYSGAVGEEITFDGSASHDPDGSIVGYHWRTSDGSWDSGWVTQPTSKHTFTAALNGRVTLEVKDDDNATGQTSTALVITACPPDPQLVKWNAYAHRYYNNCYNYGTNRLLDNW